MQEKRYASAPTIRPGTRTPSAGGFGRRHDALIVGGSDDEEDGLCRERATSTASSQRATPALESADAETCYESSTAPEPDGGVRRKAHAPDQDDLRRGTLDDASWDLDSRTFEEIPRARGGGESCRFTSAPKDLSRRSHPGFFGSRRLLGRSHFPPPTLGGDASDVSRPIKRPIFGAVRTAAGRAPSRLDTATCARCRRPLASVRTGGTGRPSDRAAREARRATPTLWAARRWRSLGTHPRYASCPTPSTFASRRVSARETDREVMTPHHRMGSGSHR